MSNARTKIEQAFAISLEDQGVIELQGADVQSWLQGQCTQDVGTLASGHSAYSLFVSNQGRIVCDAWICAGASNWKLIVPASCVAPLLERFERYIVMEDVVVKKTDERVISIVGPECENIARRSDSTFWPSSRLDQAGVEILADKENLSSTLQRLETLGAQLIEEDSWERSRIAHAAPRYGHDFGENHFPQEAGLEKRAVSFSKGCYLGQEPVAMLQHRGKIKKSLCQLSASLGVLKSDAQISSADGKPAGVVTSSCEVPAENRSLALGYVQRSALDHASDLNVEGSTITILQEVS